MAKKIIAVVKLQIPAGKATPAPPVGPALGQHGVNIMEVCKTHTAPTAAQGGTIAMRATSTPRCAWSRARRARWASRSCRRRVGDARSREAVHRGREEHRRDHHV